MFSAFFRPAPCCRRDAGLRRPRLGTASPECRATYRRAVLSGLVLPVAALLFLSWSDRADAQGGGIANAIGIAIENAAQSAAQQKNTEVSQGGSGSTAGSSASGSEEYEYEEESMDSSGGSSAGTVSAGTPAGRGSAEPSAGEFSLDPAAMGMMAVSGMFDSIAEFFERPLPADAMRYQPTLLEKAALALDAGDQRQALALYHAHLVAERDQAAGALSSVQYSPLLRRPVWAVRVGVSLHAKLPGEMADDPRPVREGDDDDNKRRQGGYEGSDEYASGAPRGRGRAGGRPSGGSSGGEEEYDYGDGENASTDIIPADDIHAATAEQAEETLDRYLGMIADVTKKELAQRVQEGKFGGVYSELSAHASAVSARIAGPTEAADPGGARRGGRQSSGEEMEMEYESESGEMSEMSSDASAGFGGPTPAGEPAAEAALTDTATVSRDRDALAMWIPGVDFVGTGAAADMLEKAREQEVDVLLHFEVTGREVPRGDDQYVTRCRVVNVAGGETLGATKLMDKREINVAARRTSTRQAVADLMQAAFEVIDAKATIRPMPQLAPNHAVSRIDQLLASRIPDQMRSLAELVMFHRIKLIDDEQLDQAIYFAAGDKGLMLLNAAPEERRELAVSMVQGELGSD